MTGTAARLTLCGWLLLFLAAAPACEEVLEVCAPCGTLAQGATTISGDPRLDGIFESVQQVARAAERTTDNFDNQLALLASEYGAPVPDDGVFESADIAAVIAAIEEQLLAREGVTVTIAVDRPLCWVDAALGLARQVACEKQSECFVRAECASDQLGSCTGLCVGECETGCSGECFGASAPHAADCLGGCVGACDGMADAGCPGRCMGSCSDRCTSYGSGGQCNGHCLGSCAGACEHYLPYDCPAICLGACEIPRGEEDSCDGECRGSCPEGNCAGSCRGHLRPEGCDLPTRCEAVLGCQETSKWLAWSHLHCEPGAAEVSVDLAPGYEGDAAAVSYLAGQLERSLTSIVNDYALLALLVDGHDVAHEIGATDLEESLELPPLVDLADPVYLEQLFVVADRVHLPLSGLLARVGVLIETGASGDFNVAAGPIPCVRPAFEEAQQLLRDLIPVMTNESGVPLTPLEAERSGGLYRVVDGQRALLALAWGTEDDES